MPTRDGGLDLKLPPYLRLYTLLRAQLLDGDLPAGSRLPTEPALTVRYGLSRGAVRNALARLEREGWLLRLPARGTFVRERPGGAVEPGRYRALLADYRELDRHTEVEVLRCERIRTPTPVLARCVALGDRVLLLARVRRHDGRPFTQVTHYMPEDLAAPFEAGRADTRPTSVVFEEQGLQPARGAQMITAIAADEAYSTHLDVPLGAPLLLVRRILESAQGRVLEYQEAVYRPDLYQLCTGVQWGRDGVAGPHWVPVPVAPSVRRTRGAGA